MRLFNLNEKNNQVIKIQNQKPILIKINTKLNTSDTSLKWTLNFATLYFNRISHLQIKARL